MAIFTYPNDRTKYYIKRIVGLPGDRIRIEGRQVFINSIPLSNNNFHQDVQNAQTPIITEKSGNVVYQVRWNGRYNKGVEEFVVPNGEVFVLGDNRGNSKDSRYFGTVPLRDVVGKASQVWMSRSDTGFRWERVGLALE
ncbi:signal peptidase I [Ningiella sp. W23]|uniref:signal peptidase I n=1 Tax=Ningiella sp. W23 TaxID=3023715 RepID=UPI003756589C